MSNRDRGLKKWHGFFMPEHSGELKNIWHEDKKIKMPVLDEYQLQEFEDRIHYTVEFGLPLEFKIFVDGFIEKKTGIVLDIDQLKREIKVKDLSGQIVFIKFDEIINLKIND